MKKLLLFLCFNLLLLGAYAQTQKVKSVYKKGRNELKVIVHHDSNGAVTNSYMFLMGRNMRYQHLTDVITVFQGSPSEVLGFFKEVKSFAIEHRDDSNIYGNVKNVRIFHDKLYGVRYNYIYKDHGYIQMNDGDFDKYIEKLQDYCKKNNISID